MAFSNCIKLTVLCILSLSNHILAETIVVETVSEFQNALKVVNPGDTIQLAEVEFYGFFRAERSGTKENPITITGTRNSVLSSWSSAFNLEASWYILRDFTVARANKGILIDGGSFNLLENLSVHDIGDEGIHFRFFSQNNTVQHCHIYNCGITRPGYGEGIYIGQDNGKWTSPEEPDRCDYNNILYNHIGPVFSENIDLKEGTCCGRIEGNFFDGTGMTNKLSDDSWVDVKGSDYYIFNNTGHSSIKDGYQVRSHMPNGGVSGCRNIFRSNISHLNGTTTSPAYAIYLNSRVQCDNSTMIYSDNVVTGGGDGLTNGWVLD